MISMDKQSEMGLDDEEKVMSHRSPTKDTEGEVFAGSGLEFYEYTFEFQAEVPYDLSENSWSNAANLRTVKPKYLEEETLNYYQTFLQEYKKGNKDFIAQKLFHSYLIQSQTYYKNKEEIQEMWDEELELLNNPSIEPQPIKDYEMVYYANGGVVYLRLKTKEDLFYRNKCAGWIKYSKDGVLRGNFFSLYLYCPKKDFKKRNLKLKMA